MEKESKNSMSRMDTLRKEENTSVKRCVYTVDEVRQMLGIGKNEAYRLVHDQSFPSIRIGNRIVIPIESFHNWLNPSA